MLLDTRKKKPNKVIHSFYKSSMQCFFLINILETEILELI